VTLLHCPNVDDGIFYSGVNGILEPYASSFIMAGLPEAGVEAIPFTWHIVAVHASVNK